MIVREQIVQGNRFFRLENGAKARGLSRVLRPLIHQRQDLDERIEKLSAVRNRVVAEASP